MPPSEVDTHDAEAVNKAENRSLYASRVAIHPKSVHGTFRRLKWILLFVLLGIYYISPFLRWDRPGDAPDQAILIDLANRRFYFFFIEIWPQEFYYVAGLLIMAGVGLFLVTSLFGRAWCGYACPQTVWTDLYIWVESKIEGDRNARIKLDAAPWTASKLLKRSTKMRVWLLIAIATGGFWVFYFADAPTLFRELVTGPRHRSPISPSPSSPPPPSPSRASCASKCAPTCARGRASRARCWTRNR